MRTCVPPGGICRTRCHRARATCWGQGALYPCSGPAPSAPTDAPVPSFCTCEYRGAAGGGRTCLVTFNDTSLERGALSPAPEVPLDVASLNDRGHVGYWLELTNGTSYPDYMYMSVWSLTVDGLWVDFKHLDGFAQSQMRQVRGLVCVFVCLCVCVCVCVCV